MNLKVGKKIIFLKKNKVFILGMLLLGILLFKNPLSLNNIIADLDPTPDSIYYLNPLISLLQGKGLVVSYQQHAIPANVPPLYSLVLLPLYLISREIRFFYITNVFLTIASAILFYKIITKLFANEIIKSLLFFAFVTDYIIYWYPSVAMAENLLIPLYLLSIWLLLQPLTVFTTLLISFLVVAFFATKYIAWVLSLALIIVFTIKVIVLKNMLCRKSLLLSLFSLNLLIFFAIFAYAEYLNKGINTFDRIINSLQQFIFVFSSLFTKQLVDVSQETYSKFYLVDNSTRYLAGIMGGSVTAAGKDFIILPIIVGVTSIFAIFVNLFNKKNRLISLYFFISIIGILYFISTFRIVDARYLFVCIPAFLLIFGIFLNNFCNFLINIDRKLYEYLLLGFVYLAIIFNVFLSVVKEIKINFFQPEDSLNYKAVEAMNIYTAKITVSPKPVIISVLSPYLIDFYSNHRYEVLPLSRYQHFIEDAERIWGINFKGSLVDVYKDYVASNRLVLVSGYRTDNKYWFHLDMQKLEEKFNLTLVAEGCNNECNLYKLEIKR